MKNYIPHIDEEKIKMMREVREAYEQGLITVDEAANTLKQKVGNITAAELAYAEQTSVAQQDDDECIKESLATIRNLYQGLLKDDRPHLAPGHPVDTYFRENDAVSALIYRMKNLHGKPFIKNQWLELFEALEQFKIHLSRKQNELYSALERKGFDRPSKTMWTYDNMVRDMITSQHDRLRRDMNDEFLAHQDELEYHLLDLIDKENTILLPTSLQMINDDEFRKISEGDYEIGFCLIEKPVPYKGVEAQQTSPAQDEIGGDLAKDIAALMGKYGIGASENGVLNVAEGKLTLEQINLIFRHLPVDLSFVDENEIVRFYSDTEHRVFPRSKGVIGREVKYCHPPKSVHVVEEIIEKFRTGEQSKAEFWINKPGLFIYIIYVAVRDDKGNFRGVLEMMQNCTHIREMEGSRTLLTWEGEHLNGAVSEAAKEQDIPAPDGGAPEINPDTKLIDLFKQYPFLKQEIVEINERFKFLQSPMAKVILPKATLALASKYGEIPYEDLVVRLKEMIAKHH
ncbi:PAS domain-containing protein [Porphyromonas pogonae]|uniref:PAS domain-containing protein n=1 Tax=Porphyromonas pogonae TaxID=867595 RepID=UPI002E763C5A|nr:PAS domain-containing protein [Porphyromonas pogonae]